MFHGEKLFRLYEGLARSWPLSDIIVSIRFARRSAQLISYWTKNALSQRNRYASHWSLTTDLLAINDIKSPHSKPTNALAWVTLDLYPFFNHRCYFVQTWRILGCLSSSHKINMRCHLLLDVLWALSAIISFSHSSSFRDDVLFSDSSLASDASAQPVNDLTSSL